MTPEPPLRMPRQEPFQRRWRPPPAVSDSPLRYGNRARAKRALSPEVRPRFRKHFRLMFLQRWHVSSLSVKYFLSCSDCRPGHTIIARSLFATWRLWHGMEGRCYIFVTP